MHQTLKDLCIEVLNGDIGSPRFNKLWLESGIPLEGDHFEIANAILTKAAEKTPEVLLTIETLH